MLTLLRTARQKPTASASDTCADACTSSTANGATKPASTGRQQKAAAA